MKRPLCCICAAFVATVFLYLQLNPLPETVCDRNDGSKITLIGEVYQKEHKGDQLVLWLKHIKMWNAKIEQSEINGVMCYIEKDENGTEPKLGSTVAVKGEVSYFQKARNYGEFDAQNYYRTLDMDFKLYKAEILAESSQYSRYREMLYRVRLHFEEIFDATLSQKDAGIMKAMLLGNKAELDVESKQLYQKSGIGHILAISGLHITLLGMGLYKLLRKTGIPQVVCAGIAVCIMTAYGDMVGMSSSAYRAVFMFGMQLTAQSFRRTYDMLTAMAMAAVLILIEQPQYVNDSGFQLSFGAILGLGCLSEVIKPACFRVFLIHFPIMLCTYYEFPIYSFLLNLVIIPSMNLVMAMGLLCLGFGNLPTIVGEGAAKLAGLICHLLLWLYEYLCTVSLRLPFANWIIGRPDNWRIIVFWAAIVYLYVIHHYALCLSKRTACEDIGAGIGLSGCIKFITVLASVLCISSSSVDGASITFMDVGQGDCIWIESAEGKHFLIDGGSTSKSKIGTYTLVPYLKYMGVSRLDAVFLTHLDNDHISGIMEMLEKNTAIEDGFAIGDGIDIGKICISDAVAENETYETLVQLCRRQQIPLYRLKTGDRILAYGLCFEVLHPEETYETESGNASSLVMKLTVRDEKNPPVTFLLTGDVESDGEQAAAGELARQADFTGIDIYKAAHHGSRYSNTMELIAQAAPELAIISCGADNSYGHPHDETIQNFKHVGSDILITKDTGAIMIKVKNGKYTVKTFAERRKE